MMSGETPNMTVEDAHYKVQDALRGREADERDGINDIRYSSLNESEREQLFEALVALYELDEALAVRSPLDSLEKPWEKKFK